MQHLQNMEDINSMGSSAQLLSRVRLCDPMALHGKRSSADLIEDCPAGRSAVDLYERAARRSQLERGEMTTEAEAE